MTVALNYEQIENNPEQISKIKPFTCKCNWKEMNFPLHKNDWKKFDTNNKTIAVNILYVPYNSKEIRHAYILKYNLTLEDQVLLLMILMVKNGIILL